MILAFELTWTGTVHAPGNSATLQVVARAFPDHDVRVYADATHVRELAADSELRRVARLEFQEIKISPYWRGKTHIVSARRFWAEFRAIRAALKAVPRGEPVLLFMLSATATGTFAAALAARLCASAKVGIHVGLHGNLNDAKGWRSRNPLRRRFDLRSALESKHLVPVRFVVLEDVIGKAIAGLIPAAAVRTDVLPLPINPAEASSHHQLRPPPLRIGYVGLGTPDKGFDTFLKIAERSKVRWQGAVEFTHVGRIPPNAMPAAAPFLSDELTQEPLSRAVFVERLARLHYVLLPFRTGYYDLSASGALLDALTWAKPVITTRVPLTEQFFGEYGDIGYLCTDENQLQSVVDDIAARWDEDHFRQQVENLLLARATREIDPLAARYRKTVERGFPGLLGKP